MLPGSPVLARQILPVDLFVTLDFPAHRVPLERPARLHGDICQYARDAQYLPFLDVRLNIVTGRDNSLSAVGKDRPDLVGDPFSLSFDRPRGELIQEYFNTDAFVPNAIGTFGNAGRNLIPVYGLLPLAVDKGKSRAVGIFVPSQGDWYDFTSAATRKIPIPLPVGAQEARGTSFAAPLVAGIALRMKQVGIGGGTGDAAEVDAIRTEIMNTADRASADPNDPDAAPLRHPWADLDLPFFPQTFDGEKEGIAQAPTAP